MKIALIGLGDIATKAYLPVLSQIENLELILCSRNQKALSQLADQYRIENYCFDYKDLIKYKPDAVMIHAATYTHFDIASFFLNHQIATFVDKPLSDNYPNVEKLYELAEKKSAPLYIGFNRRHIPLFNQYCPQIQQGNISKLLSLRWEKHRYQLPGDLRSFIFDDFIHPLDSVNICAKQDINEVDIRFQKQGDLLARLDIQWQQNECIVQASMNRQFGSTLERVQFCYENEIYEFDSFILGKRIAQNQEIKLQITDWTPMLKTKGFHSMIDEWLEIVQNNKMPSYFTKRNLSSHLLAELILQKIL